MTERLYYTDSYLQRFEARIIERLDLGGRQTIVLDRSAFYPGGGGQPHDTGLIAGRAVREVSSRAEDHAVLHLLDAPVEADAVEAEIDWLRRFDHMQQHSGQHILSRAFIERAGANTVGFHLSDNSLTIDLDRDTGQLTDALLADVEDLANRVIMENRAISARLIPIEEADSVRIRKLPDALATEGLRVVEIEDFDLTPCGGTHVSRAGAVGQIKLMKAVKHRSGTRIEFLCGGRALEQFRVQNAVIAALMADLTVGMGELPEALNRLRDDLKAAQREAKAARAEVLAARVAALLAQDVSFAGGRLVWHLAEDPAQARDLAALLAAQPGVIALIGAAGEKCQIVLARSADLTLDLRPALDAALSALGGGRGGGRPELAQGGGVPAGPEQIKAALRAAQEALS